MSQNDVTNPPLLLADAMLGRLCTWLRLIGFDTVYAGERTDHQITALARMEGRLVLTRDRGLTRHRGIRCLYVHSQVLQEQLKTVINILGQPSDGILPRCPNCNGALTVLDKHNVRDRVPPYVFETQESFSRCALCDKIYWPGTHWQHVQQTLATLERIDYCESDAAIST